MRLFRCARCHIVYALTEAELKLETPRDKPFCNIQQVNGGRCQEYLEELGFETSNPFRLVRLA